MSAFWGNLLLIVFQWQSSFDSKLWICGKYFMMLNGLISAALCRCRQSAWFPPTKARANCLLPALYLNSQAIRYPHKALFIMKPDTGKRLFKYDGKHLMKPNTGERLAEIKGNVSVAILIAFAAGLLWIHCSPQQSMFRF